MKTFQWIRVTPRQPCEICRKPDWCSHSPELGLALCMRVESDRPSKNAMGGWLHRLNGSESRQDERRRVSTVRQPPRPVFHAGRLWRGWQAATNNRQIVGLADKLTVDAFALVMLGAAWAPAHQAWAFPMRSPDGQIVGIRLRNEHGDKWAVKGSRQGLFVPTGEPSRTLTVCEGPTDTAAALTIGCSAIGRPQCLGMEREVNTIICIRHVSRVIIVADEDEPGQRGAERLQERLQVPSVIWTPPAKDIREFVRKGGTKEMMDADIRNIVWRQP